MVKYQDEEYNPALALYEKLKDMGLRKQADSVMSKYSKYPYTEGEAPPDQMKRELEALIPASQKGLESKLESPKGTLTYVLEKVVGALSSPQGFVTAAAMMMLYLV